MYRTVATFLLVFPLIACGDDASPADAGVLPDSGIDALPSDADTVVDAGSEWIVVFEDPLDDTDGPFVEGYDALPLSLFPEDASRWTQIQNSHEGQNTMGMTMRDGAVALQCLATGQAEGVASKMDVGRQGFQFGENDRVRITARLMLLGDAPFDDNTLIDLEDTDDLFIDGENPGAGLRVRTDAEGRLALDRGELPGRETPGAPAVPRLSTLRSERILPIGLWTEIETILHLGIGAAGWVELRVDGALVLSASGSNFFDRDALAEVVEGMAVEVTWADDEIDFDSFQVGATNNRSGVDREVLVDWVRVEQRR